jgi:hypothetical protein
MDLRNEHTESSVSRNILSTLVTGRRSLHQNDYSLHCTKIWDPAVRETPYDVIFRYRGSVHSCAARGKTNPTSSKAVSTPRFV